MESGFNIVTLAIETFIQRFNRKVNYHQTPYEKIFQLCDLIRARGMKVEVYMLYGFPGQTEEEFKHDVSMFKLLRPHVDQIDYHNVLLFPSTGYYDQLFRQGKFTVAEYRDAIFEGYSFNRLHDQFNFSKVPTSVFTQIVTELQKEGS